MERLLAEAGVQHPQIIEFGSLEAVLGGVASGLGVALLPRSNAVSLSNEKTLRHDTAGVLPRGRGVFYLSPRRAAERALRAFLEPENQND